MRYPPGIARSRYARISASRSRYSARGMRGRSKSLPPMSLRGWRPRLRLLRLETLALHRLDARDVFVARRRRRAAVADLAHWPQLVVGDAGDDRRAQRRQLLVGVAGRPLLLGLGHE